MCNFTALQHQRGKTVPLSAILVHNYGQDRMTFLVSQAQPGFGRCYLRTSLKGLCQLESMRSEVMQITFNCQNSIVFNA